MTSKHFESVEIGLARVGRPMKLAEARV
jgi:hypothetical protein